MRMPSHLCGRGIASDALEQGRCTGGNAESALRLRGVAGAEYLANQKSEAHARERPTVRRRDQGRRFTDCTVPDMGPAECAGDSEPDYGSIYIGSELAATVIPVGVAWERFIRSHRQPELHDADKSHPTIAGSYLAACVFLAVLLGENPDGIATDLAGLTRADAAALQKCASTVVA